MGYELIVVLLFSILFIFFIEKYGLLNPIVGHRLAIFCYTFYNPITNKILFIILSYWLIRLILRKEIIYKNKYLILLFLVGTYLLGTGIFGITISITYTADDISSYLISPYFNGVVWSIIIASTLNSLARIKTFIYNYVWFRLFEVGVTGLYFYFFQYDNLLLLGQLLKNTMRLDVDITKRLISIASRNANEAAYLLLGIGGFVFVRFYNKFNLFNSICFLILVLSLFLTWTRSGWMLFVFLLLLFFIVIRYVKARFFYNSLILSFFVILILFFVIGNRVATESRVLSDETIVLRFDLYYQYFLSIRLLPFFYGVFDSIWVTCDKLAISKYISSENIFLDTFVKYGILGGILFLSCSLVFAKNYFSIYFNLNKIRQQLTVDDYHFVVMMFCTFITIFIMLNVSLFEQLSFFWILFGISIPLKQIVVNLNQDLVYEKH